MFDKSSTTFFEVVQTSATEGRRKFHSLELLSTSSTDVRVLRTSSELSVSVVKNELRSSNKKRVPLFFFFALTSFVNVYTLSVCFYVA